MKKIVQSLLAIALLCCLSTVSLGQKDKNNGLMFTTSSNEALSFFTDGLKYFDLGENTKARESLQKAVKQDPSFATAYLHLAVLSNSPQEFVSYMDKAKEHISAGNEWEKLLYEYTSTYMTDNMDKRLTIAKKMTTSFPNSARACSYLGQAYEARQEFAMARKCYQKAVSLEPEWTGGYVALTNSLLFEDPKNFAGAEETATKLVTMVPGNASYILLGDTYRAQNNVKKAEEMYSKAITQDGQLPEAYYKRGHAFTLMGEYDKARPDYEKAASLDVNPIGAREFIAYTYLYQNDPSQALESLQNDIKNIAPTVDATKRDQFKYELLNTAAVIAMHLRDAQKLREIVNELQPLQENLGIQIGTEEAKLGMKAANIYWDGMIKLLNKDFDGAKQKAEAIKTTVAPIQNPTILDGYNFLLGSVAMMQKDYKTAVSYLEKTNKLDIYNQYCLAKAYEANGQEDKAAPINKYISDYNFNNVGYALVRSELKKKM
jgi:tetratricopeptide (TPR) repeat protein